MALATLLAVSMQLNGLLMMWIIQQAKQNSVIWKQNYSLHTHTHYPLASLIHWFTGVTLHGFCFAPPLSGQRA